MATSSRKANIEPEHIEEAAALKRLFESCGKSQAAFGADTGIGTQGAVWQYLNAKIPLNLEAAGKFASGLGVAVAEFSPRLAAEMAALSSGYASPATGIPPIVAELHAVKDQIAVWDSPSDLPPDDNRVWIDRYDYQCSAGDGVIQWEIRQKRALPFTTDYFKAIGSRPTDCKLAEARGDSMEPYLFDRDMIMIDTGKTTVRDGKVYVVCFEDEALVKQLFKQAGGVLTLHSYNQSKYPDRVVKPGEGTNFHVVGEVVYRSGAGQAAA